jgi:thymidylate kinase
VFTVALIGPDGAGKTTVARRLEGLLPFPVRSIYMGVNVEESNIALPTTRLARRLRSRRSRPAPDGSHGAPPKPRPTTLPARAVRGAKAGLRLAHWLSEEWYRQAVTAWHVRRGRLVLFDRHFFSDYHATDIAANGDRSLSRRLHGALLSRWYPKPDLVIYLDAPADVLLARKGEGTLQWLDQRRRDYLALSDLVPAFAVVDAARPVEVVAEEVAALIGRFAARTGARGGRGPGRARGPAAT